MVALKSSDRLVRFGVGQRGCVHEHLMRTLTSKETREQFEGRKPIIAVSGDTGVTGLLGQVGSLARDRRPIIA